MIVTFAASETGIPDVPKTGVDLLEIVKKALNIYGGLAKQKDIRIKLDKSGHLCKVLGNKPLLGQAVGNLIHNAAKYTPKGGIVEISFEDNAKAVVLSVSNTGPGIAEEDRGNVFRRFFQRTIPDVARGGTGLGLFITQWVIQQHGGTLSLTSEHKVETTVTVTLPI